MEISVWTDIANGLNGETGARANRVPDEYVISHAKRLNPGKRGRVQWRSLRQARVIAVQVPIPTLIAVDIDVFHLAIQFLDLAPCVPSYSNRIWTSEKIRVYFEILETTLYI